MKFSFIFIFCFVYASEPYISGNAPCFFWTSGNLLENQIGLVQRDIPNVNQLPHFNNARINQQCSNCLGNQIGVVQRDIPSVNQLPHFNNARINQQCSNCLGNQMGVVQRDIPSVNQFPHFNNARIDQQGSRNTNCLGNQIGVVQRDIPSVNQFPHFNNARIDQQGSNHTNNFIQQSDNISKNILDNLKNIIISFSSIQNASFCPHGDSYYISYSKNREKISLLDSINFEGNESCFSKLNPTEKLFVHKDFGRVFLINKSDGSAICLKKIDSTMGSRSFWLDTSSARGWLIFNDYKSACSFFPVFINQKSVYFLNLLGQNENCVFFIDCFKSLYKFYEGGFLVSINSILDHTSPDVLHDTSHTYEYDFVDMQGTKLYIYQKSS